MKNKTLTSAVVILVLVAAGGSVYALRDRVLFTQSPEQITLDFYENWVGYDGNPVADRMYNESDLTTENLKLKLNGIIDSFDKSGYDPVLCAQDIPAGIEVVNVSKDDNKAIVTLKENFGGSEKIIEAIMEKGSFGSWKIDNIICGEGENSSDNKVSPAIKEMVSSHIKNNISDLSPTDPVLGGSFYVTSIDFTAPYECIVDYEDGHIALRAKAEFQVPSAGEVVIENFEIIEDEQGESGADNFSRSGNLVERDGNWTLVYEEPGKPALTARLQFSDQSKCFTNNNEKIACEPGSWEEGSKVEVSGTETNGIVKVNNLIKKNN
jgi:hypothetical protein